jgi:uncharacterized membrane protein YedE/YeeE
VNPVLFVFLFLGPAALLLGGGLGLMFGSTASRLARLCGLGVVVVLAVLVVAVAESPTTQNCSDCSEMFGRWVSDALFVLAFGNVVVWAIAVVGGTVMRGALFGRPSPRI